MILGTIFLQIGWFVGPEGETLIYSVCVFGRGGGVTVPPPFSSLLVLSWGPWRVQSFIMHGSCL